MYVDFDKLIFVNKTIIMNQILNQKLFNSYDLMALYKYAYYYYYK